MVSDNRVVKGVLLDVDGTLVLSNDAHAHAWVAAFAQVGISVRFEDVRPLIGMGADKLVPALAPSLEHDKGLGKHIVELRQQIFLSRYASDLQPAPGSRALCKRMCSDGLQVTVASSAQKEELQVLLKIAGVDDLIDAPPSTSDSKPSKPAPDIVAAALQLLQLPPEHAIMIGDTPYDIAAAARCGVPTIAVRCGGWSDARLRGSVVIFDNPADLLAHYEGSPLCASSALSPHNGSR